MTHVGVHDVVVDLHPRLVTLQDVVPNHRSRQVAHLDAVVSAVLRHKRVVQHLAARLVRQLHPATGTHNQVPLHRHVRVVEVEPAAAERLALVATNRHARRIRHVNQPIAVCRVLVERVVLDHMVTASI